MSERFYAPQMQSGASVAIDGSEAHHLLHVMRVKVGAQVVLFDGRGHEASATVVGSSRQAVQLEVGECVATGPELPASLVLAVALPKGDRQKWLVEKLTELGVTRLIPMLTDHSSVAPNEKTLEKLRRGVVEACKQCGRNWLMEVDRPFQFAELLERFDNPNTRLIAHPNAETSLHNISWPSDDELVVAVGPEGGLSDSEVEVATSGGWQTVQLAPAILRIETAAIAAAAQIGAFLAAGTTQNK